MRKQFNHRIAGPRGFTLMEMMISVVIIGVVATLAGPRLGKELTRIEFKGSTQDLISTLRQARSLAITEKTPHAVGIDNATGAYTLFKEGATNDIIVRSSKIPGEYPSVSQSFAGPVVFSKDGSANQSGQIWAFSYDYDGTGYGTVSYATIDILASTGRIKLVDLHTY